MLATTIRALITSNSIPMTVTDTYASITNPLSSILSTRSNRPRGLTSDSFSISCDIFLIWVLILFEWWHLKLQSLLLFNPLDFR
jgi:hypothetical protein